MSENIDKGEGLAIAHIDCDAFFASCEQARNPRLKNRPLVTGKERGIIACASYEAKALGIKRGVRLYEAKRICPELIILPSDYETYSIYSKRLFAILRDFTPSVEEFSIDEAFCDLTGLRRLYRSSYKNIALEIKSRVKKELDITVSVGLSLSKTLAKICSRYRKPDGFMAVPGKNIHTFLKEIPLEMVCGFGPNTVALLQKHGINNVFDYIQRPVSFAQKMLGKIGIELWKELRGESVYRVSIEPKEKYLSISKTKTFTPPSCDKEFVKAQLMRNLESAFIKLRRHRLSAKNLGIYLRSSDFYGSGSEAGLNRHSSSTLDFTEICSGLFERLFDKNISYRATGVTLSGIVTEGIDRRDLFDDPVKIEHIEDLSKAVDRINEIHGKYAVHLASSDAVIAKGERTHREEVNPRSCLPQRKSELLKGETFRKRLGIPLLKLN
ncbi:MAG: DNA polymerase IV [Candidatus Omnitrophota bacterium]|jgi:DNA polymerase-4/DNA polymerase V